ncbi:MAG: TIGR02587 family membrane protein [Actinomycetota bacterium]|nr:TIGR02587 family membrane protein [Actinomycetota bacterium]
MSTPAVHVVPPTVHGFRGTSILVGLLAAAVVLAVLSVVRPVHDLQNAVSVVAIEALPATIGASFARSQLGEDSEGAGQDRQGRLHEIVIVGSGAVVFSASIAPTEEVVLLAGKMTELNAMLLVALSLTVMHGFVYGVGFRGGSPSPGGFWAVFVAHTVVGYVIALAVSGYLLWTFGRFDGLALQPILAQTLVLGLPASVGAAAARLIL